MRRRLLYPTLRWLHAIIIYLMTLDTKLNLPHHAIMMRILNERSSTLNTSRDVHSEKINDINYNSFLDGEHQRTLRLTFEKVANALHHVFCDVNQVHYHCHHRIRHIGYSSNLKCCCCSRRALHCLKAIHP